MSTQKDPFIRYRYLADGRTVEAQCSAADRQIAAGVAEPLDEDRAVYVAWCRESGHEVAEHVPAAVAEAKPVTAAPAAVVAPVPPEPELEPSAPGEFAGAEPELIPEGFPCAKELAQAGIVTFDRIPADLTATKIAGIGRAGALKVARALAARAEA